MGLTSGTRLGPYEIVSPLGAGGMGEVYRARDTRLDRTVAIKILPAHLSDNPEAKQRFEREARAISSLNHPNICTLYDVGHQDGIDYLVMEFLEGRDTGQPPAKGPLPLEQVLKYGIEICEGLEKAHKTGVIHRDLKPGNIMLTKTGAKLMDFGLAKAATAGATPSSSLTMTLSGPSAEQPLTARGTVVGTFQYMSAGATRREGSGRALGHFRAGRGTVRDGHWQVGVRWQDGGQRRRGDSGVGAAANLRGATNVTASVRSSGDRLPGERSGRAIAVRA